MFSTWAIGLGSERAKGRIRRRKRRLRDGKAITVSERSNRGILEGGSKGCRRSRMAEIYQYFVKLKAC